MKAAWYAVQTRPREEDRALTNIRRQGIEAYLPRTLKRRRHARRVDFAPSPLFPRYLFVRLDRGSQGWRCLESTYGVSRLVCLGDDPTPVPESVVAAIRAREDSDGFVPTADMNPLVEGAAVQVADGPFADIDAVFLSQSGEQRVFILLDLMGRKVRVEVAADSLARPV